MKTYNDWDRINRMNFVHFFRQVEQIRKIKPKKVLEIGVGDSVLANYLRHNNVEVKTLDYDAELCPDYVQDLRNLDVSKIDEHFDAVLIFETLEHLEYERVEGVLTELSKITDYIIFSVPYVYIRFFSKSDGQFGKIRLSKNWMLVGDDGVIKTRIPWFFLNCKKYEPGCFEVHYWSVGYKDNSLRKTREMLQKHFCIISERKDYEVNAVFFVLKNKEEVKEDG